MDIKKVEKAYFYNSFTKRHNCRHFLVDRKLYKARNTILVCCKDYENVKITIDDFLTYQDDGFIPHSIEKQDQVSVYPILITSKIDKDYEHNTLLALNGVLIEKEVCQKFANVYYFFDNQEK